MAAVEGTRSGDHDGAIPPLESVAFARVFVTPAARAIAATGALVAALDARAIPYHVSVGTPAPTELPDDATAIVVGYGGDGAVSTVSPESVVDTVETDGLPDHVAGLAAAVRWNAEADGEGALGVPTHDWTDGLAHSTLVRGPFSGEGDDAEAWIEERASLDARDRRSAIALACLDDHSTAAVGDAVATFLDATPLPDGPFATDAGTFDVLDVLCARHPGLALAVCCGQERARNVATTTWRREAAALHAAIDRAAIADPIVTVDDAPLPAVARVATLLTDEEEPIVVRDGPSIAIANAPESPLEDHLSDPVRHGDGRVSGGLEGDLDGLVTALREDAA